MADVSRSVYLSKKLSSVNDESSKHIYDGMFSAPAATKLNVSPFSSRINDYREIFPPSNASLGSSIPTLDLPAVDGSVGPARALSGVDYAGVFGGFGDIDGIGAPLEQLLLDTKKMAKRDAQLPRSPAQTRRMPSKSQEFSCNNGNDQTSTPSQTMRMPSKSQEFLRNYGNDQTSSPVQTRRMPSKSQEFSCNNGNDQASTPSQTMRMPSNSQELSRNYGNDQTSSPVLMRRMPSKSQEFSGNYGNDQTLTPVQTMRMPSKSQEFSFSNGNDQTSSPELTRRMPSKSQEFSRNHGNDQASTLAQTRRQHSKSQEFSRHFSNNQISTSPLQTRSPFSRGGELSGNSPNDQTSASALLHQTVDSVKHVSISYNETKQLSKDGTNGTTHIAHLHVVPGYTLLFDEAGPVRETGFVKAKRLSMNDADFSSDVGKVSRQGKHTRAVSDLGTNKQASDHNPEFQESFGGGDSHFVASHRKREFNCKPQTRSMSVSNSPQSFGGNDYFKRLASQRSNVSTNNQVKNAVGDSFLLLDEEFDVNSDAAVSAAAMERAIEEAEEKIQWAKEFLMGLESIGFIKPTLKDSFKVKAPTDTCHSYKTYGPNQNGGLKVEATRKKKCINEDKVRRKSHLKVKASAENSHSNEAGGTKLKDDLDTSESQLENLKRELHGAAGNRLSMDTTMRRPFAPETLEETPESFQQTDPINDGGLVDNTNAHEELKIAEESCKHEGGGEWEAAKHLSQLLTGVKNKLVSFMSKQADVEKTVVQKEAPSKCESLEQSEERAYKVQNVETNQERGADLEHIEEKVEMNHSTRSVAGESAHDSIKVSVDMEICEGGENEVHKSDATSSLDVEMFTSKQCGQSESEEESEYIKAQETANSTNELNRDVYTEVISEVLQEAQEQNQEILDATMKTEDENQMDTKELEECDEIPEKAYESTTYDDNGTNWEDEERVNKVQGLEPVKKRVNESLNNEAVNSRQIEDCSLKEIEMPKDGQTQQEHVGMVEETCTVEEHYERVVEAKVIYAVRVTGQDITSEANGGLTEVSGDVSEHDEHLAAADDTTKQDEVFFSKNEEASVPDETIQYVPGVGFPPEEKGSVTESATVPFEPKEDIKQSKSVQRANELFREGTCEETLRSIEVVDDDSELDEYLPANDDISEQDEFLSPSRNEEAIVHDKERMTEATSTAIEPEGGVENSNSVQMADCELNGGYRSEDSGSRSEAADRSLEQDDYLPAADESYDEDKDQYAQEVKVAAKEEKMTTGEGTSEFEGTEQPSPTQKGNELIGEEMADVSMSAGDILDLDKTEKESEEAPEVHLCTDDEITECDTVSKFEQKHSDEETRNFATDIDPDNKDDEADANTRDANQANEQDVSSHNGESSHKRRRWFENREEVGEFQLPGIFQGIERTVEMYQENAEGFKVEDKVEICVDEIVNESGEGVHMEQADAGSGQDQDGEGLHSTEGTHQRRRWFENSGGKVQLKPIPFNGVGVRADMDHDIAEEAKQDVSSQSDVDKLMNERKDGADGMDISMSNDEVKCRASTEEGNRRRRWFENGEKYGSAQRPGLAILEDNEVTAELEEEIEMRADTAKHELHEASTSEDLASTNQREGHSKERDKKKEKLAVERAMREARQRAFAEARERAAAEVRLKAAAAAQDRQGKASSETKPSSDKASMDAKHKAERAAVERATAEARERALQKAMSDKAALKSREKNGKNQNSDPSCNSGHSTSVPFTSDRSNGTVSESPQRRKAISERNRRTTELAAKALEEKNMHDLLVQKEQAEKNRFASAFDAEVIRWSSGKEGNLRSLLSTLQYILGPESGWQPIPLTDLVTATAVRKAYKRAVLCVHPDKLQQRSATIQQKYICEKVFDMLKDGWHKFNPDDR